MVFGRPRFFFLLSRIGVVMNSDIVMFVLESKQAPEVGKHPALENDGWMAASHCDEISPVLFDCRALSSRSGRGFPGSKGLSSCQAPP